MKKSYKFTIPVFYFFIKLNLFLHVVSKVNLVQVVKSKNYLILIPELGSAKI